MSNEIQATLPSQRAACQPPACADPNRPAEISDIGFAILNWRQLDDSTAADSTRLTIIIVVKTRTPGLIVSPVLSGLVMSNWNVPFANHVRLRVPSVIDLMPISLRSYDTPVSRCFH